MIGARATGVRIAGVDGDGIGDGGAVRVSLSERPDGGEARRRGHAAEGVIRRADSEGETASAVAGDGRRGGFRHRVFARVSIGLPLCADLG